MPISGVVITCVTKETARVREELVRAWAPALEIHGADDKGNLVAVLDTASSEEMEKLIDAINEKQEILGVGITYLNTEDEAERMAEGERLPRPPGFRKPVDAGARDNEDS